MIWWACGTGGLHFTLLPAVRQCFWGHPERNGDTAIDVFIDSDFTTSPTASPTPSPSNWNQHPGHLTNWTVAQDRITALEQTVARLEAERSNYVTTTAMEQTLSGERVENGAGLAALRTDVGLRIDAVNDSLATLQSALRMAVAAVVSPPATSTEQPRVEARGSDLALVSPGGAITVETSACGAFDLCDLSGFQQRRADAIAAA